MKLIDEATRFLFFTGKGGVGKTSLSSATAIALADRGRRVLLVSTDPASNLDQVLGVALNGRPTAVPGVPGLEALNIDPEKAAAEYRERTVGPFRGVLPDESVRQIEEQLSGGCTVEVAAFDEFARLLGQEEAAAGWDHILFDTAPTGHTLRLLSLPSAWDGFLKTNTSGTSCLGPLSGLGAQQAVYAAAVATLQDPARTTLVLVARPETSAIAEAARTQGELGALGLDNQRLVVNGLLAEPDPQDELAVAFARRGREALQAIPEELRRLPLDQVPLQPVELVGIEALRSLLSGTKSGRTKAGTARTPPKAAGPLAFEADSRSLEPLIEELAAAGHGLVMVMGKGGVGKTTIAAALAVELARRGLPVHLTTTDPAAHLTATLAGSLGSIEGLRVSRIDPAAETRAHQEHVLATAGAGLDASGRALLEEDLRSPCTEEVAVFQAFSRTLRESRRGIVILDTAPTGHTLLLLDTTGAFHRDVMRTAGKSGRLTTPLMMLQDPALTRVLIVTLPESTPVDEAARLQQDLRRAGIEPWGWVLNRSLAAAGARDAVLAGRAALEMDHVRRVETELARRVAILPWLAREPVGAEGLSQVFAGAAITVQ
jgi:arsenite-transporting ATPase